VPHQRQVNNQSSRLLPCTPSLLENPLTFFTNTRHLLQWYHLSFSTKKDCIFSRNTVVNIEVAPVYRFATSSLSQSRNNHNLF
jgi:hypothetical protein